MKLYEYIKPHIRVVDNHVRINAIAEGGPYCAVCLQDYIELEPTYFSRERNAWVCRLGHECKSTSPATGGTV